MIKFFVDYLVPYFWTMGENRIQKFQLDRCSEQTENDHAGIYEIRHLAFASQFLPPLYNAWLYL